MQLSKDFVGVLERAPCGYIKAPINEPAVLATGAVHYSRFVAANVFAAVRPPPPPANNTAIVNNIERAQPFQGINLATAPR